MRLSLIKILKNLLKIAIICLTAYLAYAYYSMKAKQYHPDIWLTGNMEFSQDGELFALSTRKYSYLINLREKKVIKTNPNISYNEYSNYYPTFISISSDNRYFASRDFYRSFYSDYFTLYDILSDKIIYENFIYSAFLPLAFSFSPNNKLVFINNTSYLDIHNKTVNNSRQDFFGDYLFFIREPIDEKWIASFYYPKSNNGEHPSVSLISPFNAESGIMLKINEKNLPAKNIYESRDFMKIYNTVQSGGSRLFVLNDKNYYMFVIDFAKPETKRIPIREQVYKKDYQSTTWEQRVFCVSQDGEYFAVVSNNLNFAKNALEIRVYNTSNGVIVSEIKFDIKESHWWSEPVFNMAINPQESLLAVGYSTVGRNDYVEIYNYMTKEKVYKLTGSSYLNIHKY